MDDRKLKMISWSSGFDIRDGHGPAFRRVAAKRARIFSRTRFQEEVDQLREDGLILELDQGPSDPIVWDTIRKGFTTDPHPEDFWEPD